MRLWFVSGTSTKHACDLEANSRVWSKWEDENQGQLGFFAGTSTQCLRELACQAQETSSAPTGRCTTSSATGSQGTTWNTHTHTHTHTNTHSHLVFETETRWFKSKSMTQWNTSHEGPLDLAEEVSCTLTSTNLQLPLVKLHVFFQFLFYSS